jgi:restriction system protein
MPIPAFDKLFHPILELATKEPVTRNSANEAMTRLFKLKPTEIDEKLASGGSKMRNRTGWAMTFLTKASLIERVAPKTYKATKRGVEFLKTHPNGFSEVELRALPGYEQAWEEGRQKRLARGRGETVAQPSTETPEEIIEHQVNALNSLARERLIEAILAQSPEFFEHLVLEVLQAMGYGGKLATATEHLGQSGDEGIDGRINQDALGLDQILVQAKRYAPENIVGRPAIQGFIGSLASQGVTKGVFITTSAFTKEARECVQRGSNLKVVLIDGESLIDLMLKHGIGCRVKQKYEVFEMDQNYFDESE